MKMQVVTVKNGEETTQTVDLNALEKSWTQEYAMRESVYNAVTTTVKWLTYLSIAGLVGYSIYGLIWG